MINPMIRHSEFVTHFQQIVYIPKKSRAHQDVSLRDANSSDLETG